MCGGSGNNRNNKSAARLYQLKLQSSRRWMLAALKVFFWIVHKFTFCIRPIHSHINFILIFLPSSSLVSLPACWLLMNFLWAIKWRNKREIHNVRRGIYERLVVQIAFVSTEKIFQHIFCVVSCCLGCSRGSHTKRKKMISHKKLASVVVRRRSTSEEVQSVQNIGHEWIGGLNSKSVEEGKEEDRNRRKDHKNSRLFWKFSFWLCR